LIIHNYRKIIFNYSFLKKNNFKKEFKKRILKIIMNYFVEIAYNEAKKSNVKNQYGAVLIYRNKVISKGYNSLYVNVKKSSILCP
jgi:deoxycytidylate deaminase